MVKKHHPYPAPSAAPEAVEAAAATSAPQAGQPGPEAAGALMEPAAEALRRLEQEAAEWKDRCLRTAADLENLKKRQIRERSETAARAQGEVIARVLEVVDDLARVAALDPGQTSSQALHEGMGLVERKLLKVLEGAGVERVDPAGQPFDPNLHEAVMTVPAPSPEADHTVASVLQPGYRLNGALLRAARVAVYTWTPPAAPEAAQ
ncbi:MAG TPA: nucleotide exchange factor GrpE [Gemmatimonadales bacterium]|nr:nucleotide exchange factor GrpE [Gemmatimonadales bacterium]